MLLLPGYGTLCGKFPSSTANTRTGTQSLQVGLTMTQTTKEAPTTNIINPNWILLDTCSTISSIRNKSLVQNIQPCDTVEELRAYKNGGNQYYDHTATFKMLTFEVLFNEKFLANMLSFNVVASKFKITIDTELDPSINANLHY